MSDATVNLVVNGIVALSGAAAGWVGARAQARSARSQAHAAKVQADAAAAESKAKAEATAETTAIDGYRKLVEDLRASHDLLRSEHVAEAQALRAELADTRERLEQTQAAWLECRLDHERDQAELARLNERLYSLERLLAARGTIPGETPPHAPDQA
jgi:hypothetical protein